jgi:serine protease Do
MMRKILVIVLLVFMTGCTTVDEEQLKNDIKEEILEEIQFDPSLFNEHLIEISSSINKWTVAIEVTVGETTTIGSGIIYSNDENEYLILTNEHVVRYADSIEVFIPSQDIYITATIVKTDTELDLAILSISTLTELSYLEIVDVEYQIGEIVLACGTPISQEYPNSITLGIISNIYGNTIQHDASINIGNSGGPLFNLYGELIGINVSKINTTYIGNNTVFVEGMGFSIGIDTIILFISE